MGTKGSSNWFEISHFRYIQENISNDLFVGTFNDGSIYRFELTEDRTKLELPASLHSGILKSPNSTGKDKLVFGSDFGGISGIAVSPE